MLIDCVLLVLKHVEHLDGCLDGGFRLVGIQASGAIDLSFVLPGDGSLDKGIGTSSRRNGDHVVGEPGEGAVQFVSIDVTYGTYKCIILTIARGRLLVLLPIDVKFYASLGMQTIGSRRW